MEQVVGNGPIERLQKLSEERNSRREVSFADKEVDQEYYRFTVRSIGQICLIKGLLNAQEKFPEQEGKD